MKNGSNNIWVGQKDLTRDEDFIKEAQLEFNDAGLLDNLATNEVAENVNGNRRDFLKFLGFGLGAATVAAGCDIPVKRAIPYVVKPDEIVPGVATYYASSYVEGGDFVSILVKTREGRPIKIEGNSLNPITKGGTSARSQAYVLDLYNTARLKGPQVKSGDGFSSTTWKDLDDAAIAAFSSGNTAILSSTIISKTLMSTLEDFKAKFSNVEIVYADSVSYSGLLDASEADFGFRGIPDYKFDKADVIVSFDADFLGTWVSPVEYTKAYAKGRKIDDVNNPKMSRHIQVESHMSITGSNADNRVLVKPSELDAAVAYLANEIVGGVSLSGLNDKAQKQLSKVAKELKAAYGKSLVVSGSNNPATQKLVNAINNALGNIGNTVNLKHASLQKLGSDSELETLIAKMNAGGVDNLIIHDNNLVYSSANGKKLAEAIGKVKNKFAVAYELNETSSLCDYIAPVHHGLESWGDATPKMGHHALIQPTIAPLFNTRQAGETFLSWAGSINDGAEQPYLDYLKEKWRTWMFPKQNKFASFNAFWDSALHDGSVMMDLSDEEISYSYQGSIAGLASQLNKPSSSELEIKFYESVALGNGQFASNPWLQEMPDPIARTVWGNYLAVPVNFDGVRTFNGLNGLEDGDLAEVTIGDQKMTVPVIQQFGMAPGTVALALGYGREMAGSVGTGVGANVNAYLTVKDGKTHYYNDNVSVSPAVGKEEDYSSVQYHHTYGVEATDSKTGTTINADEAALVSVSYGLVDQGYQGALTDRSVIYNSSLDELKEKLDLMHTKREHAQHLNEQQYYSGHDYLYENGHHWGMHVDLNACTGCGACTVACMAENNVPVVGKKEVSRHHEMTWLRIDRYYYGDAENPNVVYQPMMCQHCDNAPCENVCPVNATNHSSEGLNQMTYNRCVGTRYCANNCPYKVRRFNWMDYTTADIFPANQPRLTDEEIPFGADNLTRMVLNPDVTVRARGVIEKCSFCVQRIQEGKLTAKREGRQLRDADVRSACQTACPTGAITFGDMNNKKGDLNHKLKSPLNYIALEEVNVRSSVTYTMKVNNKDKSLDA
jgi:Fe-S-cluster-containing dehydrogenase component